MEPTCTTKTFFYYTCTHSHVRVSHIAACPESKCCTPTGCLDMHACTFIVATSCDWCTGKEVFPGSDPAKWPQIEEGVKEERRRAAERLVRGQMVECEDKADQAKGATRR
jgi:hypothetical protein